MNNFRCKYKPYIKWYFLVPVQFLKKKIIIKDLYI